MLTPYGTKKKVIHLTFLTCQKTNILHDHNVCKYILKAGFFNLEVLLMLAGLLNSALWRSVLYFCLFTLSFVLQCRREISHIKFPYNLLIHCAFKRKAYLALLIYYSKLSKYDSRFKY